MVLIFAKYNTKERIAVESVISMIPHIQKFLNDTLGGQWLRVDALAPHEFFIFEATDVYQGFDVSKDRYFDAHSLSDEGIAIFKSSLKNK